MITLLSANAGPLQPFSAGRLQREPVGSHSIPLLYQKTIGFEELEFGAAAISSERLAGPPTSAGISATFSRSPVE